MAGNGFFLGGFAQGASAGRADRRAGQALALQERGLDLEQQRNDLTAEDQKARRRAELFARDRASKDRALAYVKGYRTQLKGALDQYSTEAKTLAAEGGTDEQQAALRRQWEGRLAASHTSATVTANGLVQAGETNVASFQPLQTLFDAIAGTVPSEQELRTSANTVAERAVGPTSIASAGVTANAVRDAPALARAESAANSIVSAGSTADITRDSAALGRAAGVWAVAEQPGLTEAALNAAPGAGEAEAIKALSQAGRLAEENVVTTNMALKKVGLDGPQIVRVVSGDTEEGARLGIPPGKQARVQYSAGVNGALSNPTVLGAFGGGNTNVEINMGGDLAEQLGKEAGKLVTGQIEVGFQAADMERSYLQAAELLGSGLKTGRAQNMLLFFNAWAKDLGIDFPAWAKKQEFDIGQIGKQETFRRVTTELVIAGFEKFKGNLNQKEVDLAENAFAKLGDDEESNIDAIAAGLAAIEIAKTRGTAALNSMFAKDPGTAAKEALMLRMETGTGEDFMALKAQKVAMIKEQLAAFEANPASSKMMFNFKTPEDVNAASIQDILDFTDQIVAAGTPVDQAIMDAMDKRLSDEVARRAAETK